MNPVLLLIKTRSDKQGDKSCLPNQKNLSALKTAKLDSNKDNMIEVKQSRVTLDKIIMIPLGSYL